MPSHTDVAFDVRAAWEAVTKARERGDASGEALALTVLGQALHEADRSEEARYFHDQAAGAAPGRDVRLLQAEVLMKRGTELAETGGDPETAWGNWHGKDQRNAAIIRQREWALSAASWAFRQAGAIFWEIGERRNSSDAAYRDRATCPKRIRAVLGSVDPSSLSAYVTSRIRDQDWHEDESRQQAGPASPSPAQDSTAVEEVDEGGPSWRDDAHAAPASLLIEVAAGFLAVKMLGPFLETFATKLGERFGESASEALGRIRVTRRRNGSSRNLEIEDPETATPTVLVLPEEFTEEARLAVIELDVTTEQIRGATLRWNPASATWQVTDAEE
ncbi:hypothetical protein [Streptomyces sp. NPDC001903]|uniref:hypothetical protein n=1 Tax=Streptomyces sp. NPDC001903 TaxID=3364622 RepID=UPI00369E9F43